jgi:hypothetical protein
MDLKETGQESEQIYVVQNRDKRQTFMKMIMNIWDPLNVGTILTLSLDSYPEGMWLISQPNY